MGQRAEDWRKLHLGVDEATGEIKAAVVSTNDIADCKVLLDLLEQIPEDIEQVSADGAYDTQDCYDAIEQQQALGIHSASTQRACFGSMATVKPLLIHAIKTCAASA